MAIKIETTINNYLRLPVSDMPSNQPYQPKEGNTEEVAARSEAKRAFLSESATEAWPTLEYSQLNMHELMAYRSMLIGLLEDIDDAHDETPEGAQDSTYETIAQKLNELYRHISVRQRLGSESLNATWLEDSSEENLRLRSVEQNLRIFGRPDVARFNWFLAADRRLAEARASSDTPLVRAKAQQFLESTSAVESFEQSAPIEIDAETRQQLREDLFAIFPGLEEFSTQDFPESISPEDSLPYFNKMRDILQLPADQYEAYLVDRRACEESPRGVAVGRKRAKPFTGDDITRLALHEWTHVMRRHNAREQEAVDKRLATPSNLAFEEAFCVLIERTLIDQSYVSGAQYYRAIGLQLGLDTTQDSYDLSHMRDFRQTLDITAIIDGLKAGAEDEEAFAAKRTSGYSKVLRTTRGGAMDARDLSYHIGDQRAKEAILAIKELPTGLRRDKLRTYFMAQYDPTSIDDSVRFETEEMS